MPQHSEHIAVNDLLGKPPGWLLRSGITLVFIIVVSGLILSAFIHYPDELNGQVIIQREKTPVPLTPAISTFIDSIFLEDRAKVEVGEVIAVLHSDANWQEIMALNSFIKKGAKDAHHYHFKQLGKLQPLYARWLATWKKYKYYSINNPTSQSEETILQEVHYNQDLLRISKSEANLLDQQIDLEKNDYHRQLELSNQGVISIQELEEKEKRWLAFLQQRKTLSTKLIEYELRINNLKGQLNDLTSDNRDNLFELEQAYQQLTEELSGGIQEWEDIYLLRATIAGRIIFHEDVSVKQQVSSMSPLLFIEPNDADQTAFLAKISIPSSGLGKTHLDDDVIIRLVAYPEKEYGTIRAQVNEIRALPSVDQKGETSYQIIAKLEDPLVTTYEKTLPIGLHTNGTATIITKNRSILSRVFEQLFFLVNQNNFSSQNQ